MIIFENTIYLYGLLLIPLFFLLYIFLQKRRIKLLSIFGNYEFIQKLFNDVSQAKRRFKFILLQLGLASFILGLANPQIGSKVVEAKREGIDIIFILDVSRSMLAEDDKPNRLERAKFLINKILDNLQNDRIGIIIFAADAYLQLPLTTDYAAGKLYLSSIDNDMLTSQGTSIGAAIDLAVEDFTTEDKVKKAILLFTDGENHEDDPVSSAKDAAKQGFSVFTIGMGSSKGVPIPLLNQRGEAVAVLKDEEGNPVVSQMNQSILQEIALSADGKFFTSNDISSDIESFMNDISKFDKQEFETKQFSEYESQFQYFIALALFFWLIEIFINHKQSNFLKKFNFFGEKNA